jgi:hypothetical protein
MYQIKASIYLLLNEYEKSLVEFDNSLNYFRQEKKR